MQDIKIKDRVVGANHKPFIIAEMSGNHNQSLERALEIVKAAASTNVDAIKLQTYTADTMTIDLKEREFLIEDKNSLWCGNSLYNLYQQAHTPWEWHEKIFNLCEQLGLLCFSTPFDDTAVDFLESLNVPCYKVASFEITDISLIQRVASTGKPIIISTGMASISEIDLAVSAAKSAGCKDLILLKCTSSYPASPENSNISTISHMRDLFQCQVGLSDHTLGIGVAVAAVALGATVIEKHFTLSRHDGGVDAAFSLEPNEMQLLVKESEQAKQALGIIQYGPTNSEQASLVFRRSLYVVDDMKRGDIISGKNIKAIRPGLGLPPKYIKHLLGKTVNRDIKKGTPLSWELLA